MKKIINCLLIITLSLLFVGCSNSSDVISLCTKWAYNTGVYVTYEYDENYNLITETYYDNFGVYYKIDNRYNQDGICIGYDYWLDYATGVSINDEHGNSTSFTWYRNEDNGVDSAYEYINEYDSNGNLLVQTMIFNGQEYSKTEYTYDKNGNCLSEDYHENDYNYNAEYEYDNNGNSLKETLYVNGILTNVVIREYDKKGRLISEMTKDGEGGVNYHFTYEFVTEDGVNKSYQYDNGELFAIYEYDEYGNKVTYSQIDEAGNPFVLQTWEYKIIKK